MQRRTFITTVGSIAIAGAAGCTGSESVEPASGSNENNNDNNGGGDSGGGGSEPTDEPQPTATEQGTAAAPAEGEWVGILEHEWTTIEEYDSDVVDDMYGVVGTAQNNHDAPITVFVTAVFLDSDGVQIGDSIHSADGVQPGRKFAFELPYLEDDADEMADYELRWEAYEG